MKSICIFCGAKSGKGHTFETAAISAAQIIAKKGIDIVYGGGRVGLMGSIADAALAAGGRVIGVIPEFLATREIEHRGLTEIHIVASMHERKTKMADLSNGFVALPGGAGTLEEIFEQWTWAQLGIHTKPVGFLNHEGFYDPLVDMIHRMRDAEFIHEELVDMVVVEKDIGALLQRFNTYEPPQKRWT